MQMELKDMHHYLSQCWSSYRERDRTNAASKIPEILDNSAMARPMKDIEQIKKNGTAHVPLCRTQ